jgi:hypothetical protein
MMMMLGMTRGNARRVCVDVLSLVACCFVFLGFKKFMEKSLTAGSDFVVGHLFVVARFFLACFELLFESILTGST